ncbi:histidine phosphatase family protein [Pseudactinotalea sp. Z1732]|uniref:histidine phosphatase family protein n=1 Tax=Pseudactinotalea sp. Z1732 TaxID=3413026 RepID=UPI003C7D637F
MITDRLHLVRHARPRITEAAPPRQWELAAGADVGPLLGAGALPTAASWFTSPEPKARQSAALLTGEPVQVLPALAEVARDGALLPAAEFRAATRDYLTTGKAPSGATWEPRVEATMRIVDGALAALESSTHPACVLVGHGTAFTLLVAALVGAPPDADAWARLNMPDHCELAAGPGGAFEVVSPWGRWARAAR